MWKNGLPSDDVCTLESAESEVSEHEARSSEAKSETTPSGDEGQKDKESNSENIQEETPYAEKVDQLCYDIEGLSDVPLIIKILGVEHRTDLFDVNPNMFLAVECGMYV